MKLSIGISIIAFLVFATLPYSAQSATSAQKPSEVQLAKTEKVGRLEAKKHISFKEKISKKVAKFKQRIRHWKEVVQMSFPSGKLLTSLVFLVLSIVFFAVGGATTLGVLFNILGSAAVIAALVFFVLWLSERTSAPIPGD